MASPAPSRIPEQVTCRPRSAFPTLTRPTRLRAARTLRSPLHCSPLYSSDRMKNHVQSRGSGVGRAQPGCGAGNGGRAPKDRLSVAESAKRPLLRRDPDTERRITWLPDSYSCSRCPENCSPPSDAAWACSRPSEFAASSGVSNPSNPGSTCQGHLLPRGKHHSTLRTVLLPHHRFRKAHQPPLSPRPRWISTASRTK